MFISISDLLNDLLLNEQVTRCWELVVKIAHSEAIIKISCFMALFDCQSIIINSNVYFLESVQLVHNLLNIQGRIPLVVKA